MRSAPNETVSSMKPIIDDLQKGGGWAQISSGRISSPVDFFDVSFPAGYSIFNLLLESVVTSNGDQLVAGVGVGAGWFNDPVNQDTYSVVEMIKGGSGGSGDTTAPIGRYGPANDSLMDFGDTTCTDGVITIMPGDTSLPPRLRTDVWFARWGGVGVAWPNLAINPQLYSLNPLATVAPVLGRITKIRLLPYGTGNITPSSGHEVTGGSWYLLGMPAAG